MLALIFSGKSFTFENFLAIFVEFELGDHNLGGINANEWLLPIELLLDDTLDMQHPLLTVNSNNLAGCSLVAPPGDLNFIITANWQAADVVLGTELLGKWCAHQFVADV